MAVLDSTPLKRVFKFEKNGQEITLEDFNPLSAPEDIIKFYVGQYPELTNATIEQPTYEGSNIIFNISNSVGSKG